MTDPFGSAYAAILERVTAIYRALDRGDASAVGDNFAKAIVWHRPDGDLRGHDEVAQMLSTRAPDRETAHLVTNLAIEQVPGDASCWKADYALLVFAGTAGLGRWVGILACQDHLVKQGARFLVTKKSSVPLMRPSVAAP